MSDLTKLTDTELIDAAKKAAESMSYYNAAEGSSWSQERVEREACRTKLNAVRAELVKRSLEFPRGDYLL